MAILLSVRDERKYEYYVDENMPTESHYCCELGMIWGGRHSMVKKKLSRIVKVDSVPMVLTLFNLRKQQVNQDVIS